MIQKLLYITLISFFILFTGCAQTTPVVETTPTPVAVTQTYIETQTPTETVGSVPTNDMGACFNRSDSSYPDYCADYYYWVKPTTTPVGMGYTAKVWRNSSCVDLNRTSGECEGWGDDSYVATFLHNLTIVRNLTSVNMSEVIASLSYYNTSYNLNVVNGVSFDNYISTHWDGTYPS